MDLDAAIPPGIDANSLDGTTPNACYLAALFQLIGASPPLSATRRPAQEIRDSVELLAQFFEKNAIKIEKKKRKLTNHREKNET